MLVTEQVRRLRMRGRRQVIRQQHSQRGRASKKVTCEISKRVVMKCVQVGLALQLDSSAQGCHWAAPKPFCHAAQVAAQLQHLLHLAHLHLIVGFCPAAQPGQGEGGPSDM